MEGASRACFDGISHEGLWAHIPREQALRQKWLPAGCVDKHVLSPPEAGVPQGGIASPGIANLALDGLERRLRADAPPTTRAKRAKGNVVKYADDFLITGSAYELLAQAVTPLVEQVLHERGLELSQQQTRSTHIEAGCDFLGQHLRKYAGKLLRKPARKHVTAGLGRIREIVKAHLQATAGNLIAPRHPVIRGWATYHRHVGSNALFFDMDTAIFKVLWTWATRRPPKQSGRWIAEKDFRTRNGRRGTFVGTRVGTKGQPLELTRCRAGDVPIQRHITIKGAANPSDPPWEVDFEARLGVRGHTPCRGDGSCCISGNSTRVAGPSATRRSPD